MSNAAMRLGYHEVAEAIVEESAGPIFGLLGDANLAAVAHAVQLGSRLVASRHESGAISMAAGYARATGSVAFATTTRGPGFVNALGALVSATRDRAPMVFLAGNSPAGAPPSAQSMDQEAMVRPTGARFLRVSEPGQLRAATVAAFRLASLERRPVVLDVPTNFMHLPQAPRLEAPRTLTPGIRAQDAPDSELLHRAARLLAQARRPVILAGRGAIDASASDSLRTLAERAGALLCATLPALGIFDGDAFDLGLCGGFSLARTRKLLNEADVVLAIGASLNRYTLAEGQLLSSALIIQCDVVAAAIGRTRKVDIGLVGDAAVVADEIGSFLVNHPRRGRGYRTDRIREFLRATDAAKDVPEQHGPDGVDPRAVLRAVDREVPDSRRVVVDVGHFSAFPCQVLRSSYPGQLLPAFGFGSVGLALSTAIGVSVADRERPVIAVIGDGGLLMSLGELDTAVRAGGALVIVVLNDAAYAAEVHHLLGHGLPPHVAQFPRTDFAAVSAALGMDSFAIDSVKDFARLKGVGERRTPVLIDVRVNPAVVSERFAKHPA